MFESVHRLGSRLRHSPALRRQEWVWRLIEPAWQAVFRASSSSGFSARVNEDVFKLEYAYGSRYDREDSAGYEPIVYKALLDNIREGMVVCDIGAHIGLLTLAAAKRVGPSGRVFAFEPAPDIVRTLRNHVRFNGYERTVDVVNAVVGDVTGTTPFYVYGDSMSASLGRDNLDVLSPQRLTDPQLKAVEVTMPSTTLDDFARKRTVEPDLLKIDVEGAELLVLRGARELLTKKAVVVLCEVHPMQMTNCRSSVDELEKYVAEIGYGIERLDPPGPQGIFHALVRRRTT